MIERLVPVVGAETLRYRSTGRPGDGKTIGVRVRKGFDVVIGRSFACLIKA